MAKDISELLGDLSTRARLDTHIRNRPIQKIMLVADSVAVTNNDTVTMTQKTPPFKFGADAAVLVIGMGQFK